jgi:hypothetical protein
MRPPIRCIVLTLTIVAAAHCHVVVHAWVVENLTPQQQHDLVVEAQQSYQRGIDVLRNNPTDARAAFATAARKYELVLDSGIVNGPLLYNLGNAHLQAGNLGLAILNYRRAEQFMPNDGRLQSNLRYARSLCRSQIPASGERALVNALLWWHSHIPLHIRLMIFLTGYVIFWLAVLARLVGNGRWSGVVLSVSIVSGIVWVVLGGSVAAEVFNIGSRAAGVVIADNVIARKGNGLGFEPQFEQPLSQGVEFQVTEQRGDWLDIQLANNSRAWIPAESAAIISKTDIRLIDY